MDPNAISIGISVTQLRKAVIHEALTWEYTPFRWHASIKGPQGGCDCGELLKASYAVVGIDATMPKYSTQFFLHDADELYIREVEKYCVRVESPERGDIVLYLMGKAHGHAGIAIEWPKIIHASARDGYVNIIDGLRDTDIGWRDKMFYSPKQWH